MPRHNIQRSNMTLLFLKWAQKSIQGSDNTKEEINRHIGCLISKNNTYDNSIVNHEANN